MTRPSSSVLVAMSVALVLAATVLGACAGTGSPAGVTFLGTEPDQFDKLRKRFTEQTGIEVNYQDTRAQDQILPVDVQSEAKPDVAALSSPGELAWYASQDYLQPLDDVVSDTVWRQYTPQWKRLAQLDFDHRYAVPLQVNLKSMVWYNTNSPPPPVPHNLDELSGLRPVAGGGPTWCMGMGSPATSGWPGTDWIEDILLQRYGPGVYQRWAAGELSWAAPEVSTAWKIWGEIAEQVRGGPDGALLTDFGDAGRPMFDQPQGCFLEHQSSFIKNFYMEYRPADELAPGDDFDYFDFPRLDGKEPDAPGRSREVGADMLVMFNDTPQARQFIKFMVSKSAQQELVNNGSFSARTDVSRGNHPDAVSRRIAATLVGADTLCYDASDMMPATMRHAFYRAVLEYLNNPGQIGSLLSNLDNIRNRLPEEQWLTVSCGQEQ